VWIRQLICALIVESTLELLLTPSQSAESESKLTSLNLLSHLIYYYLAGNKLTYYFLHLLILSFFLINVIYYRRDI